MGKHSREIQLQKEIATRKKRRMTAGAAGLILAATSAVGYSILNSDKASSSPMPNDVVELVNEAVNNGSAELKNAVKAPYREVLATNVGQRTLTIAEVGEQKPGNYEDLVTVYRRIDSYLHGNPENSLHAVTEYDEGDFITAELLLDATITPVDKDMVLLVAPVDLDLGSYDGVPDVFTDQRTSRTISVVRPDIAGSFEGMVTEACQSMVNVELAQPEQIAAERRDIVTLLLQEQVCNSLSKALVPASLGVTYENYSANAISGTRQMFTDPIVEPGERGYVSVMPYVGEQTYSKLSGEIPAGFGQDLVFPTL